MSTTLCQSDYASQRDLVSLYSLMIWNLLIVAKRFKTQNILLIPDRGILLLTFLSEMSCQTLLRNVRYQEVM